MILTYSFTTGTKKLSYRLDSRPYCLTAPLGVTWRHWWRDDLIVHMPFPIGGHLEPSIYL